jgi:hypothetical protein
LEEKNKQQNLFREKTIERISSPEKLTDYLRVTSPGIWAVLGAVIILLGGLFIWASIGTLETKADVKVMVADHKAVIVADGATALAEGMPVKIATENCVIASTDSDEYGRTYGITEVSLPDGTYDGTAVIEQIRPIDFLLESR